MATTSLFSTEARAKAREYDYQLKLADKNKVLEWIGNYGKWKMVNNTGLWIPDVDSLN